MNEKEKRLLGGKIHKILNNTISRPLTMTEYIKLVKLISKVFSHDNK